MASLPSDGVAVVVGAHGAIGSALFKWLASDPTFVSVTGLSRGEPVGFDLTNEASIASAAQSVGAQALPLRLLINATGYLHGDHGKPEKGWRDLDPDQLAHAFAVNAIGPALLMKHFMPLMPRSGKSVFGTISARVGSIGDNRIGGRYGYRASKAALNQLVRTAAIELRRRRPAAICVALHPGTVDSPLSAPFAKSGLNVTTPDAAAAKLLAVIDRLGASQTGAFFDYSGKSIPW